MCDLTLFLVAAAKRKERGISLDQIANATKISIRWLKAIEEGDFKKLPGGICNTNYIRQYAQAVDVDEGELLSVYKAATDPSPEQPRARKRIDRPVSARVAGVSC